MAHKRTSHRKIKQGANFSTRIQSLPSEVKIVVGILAMFALLYTFQSVPNFSFLKPNADAVTGLAVSQPEKQNEPTAATVTIPAAKEAPQPSPAQQQQPVSQPVDSPELLIKIISPEKGSTLTPGFDIQVEFSSQAITCYYQVRDSGTVTWDRRMKPCRNSVTAAPSYCKTAGKDTCFVRVEAYSGDGNTGTSDETYYSIK